MKNMIFLALAFIMLGCEDECITAYEPTIRIEGEGLAVINTESIQVDSSAVWVGQKAFTGDMLNVNLSEGQTAVLTTNSGRLRAAIDSTLFLVYP